MPPPLDALSNSSSILLFRPGREQFCAALAGALPDVLTGPAEKPPQPVDELAHLVNKLQSGTAMGKDKKRLRILAAKV